MSKKNEHISFADFMRLYAPAINEYINEFYSNKELSSSNAEVQLSYNLLKEYCTRDGKRIRPLLLLLSYLGYGGDSSCIQSVIPVAASLECMHAFLLIQDDIIDGASMRRGKPAFHKVCDSYYKKNHTDTIGSWVAIVLADVLMSNALQMIMSLDEKYLKVFLHEFAAIYERTAFGQMLDIIWSNPEKFDDGIPNIIAAMKTAHYTISGPLRLGYCIAGGTKKEEMQRLEDLGYAIGFAFQMRDDIIGAFGSEEDSGKSASLDIEEGKYTVLVHKAIEKLPETEKTHFISLFNSKQKDNNDILRIKEYIRKSGAIEEVQDVIAKYIKDAEMIIPQLNCNTMMKQYMVEFIKSLFS